MKFLKNYLSANCSLYHTHKHRPLQAPDTFPILSGVNSAFLVNFPIFAKTASF